MRVTTKGQVTIPRHICEKLMILIGLSDAEVLKSAMFTGGQYSKANRILKLTKGFTRIRAASRPCP
jgi:hypothetical protein